MRLILIALATLFLVVPASGQTAHYIKGITQMPEGYLIEHCYSATDCTVKRDTSRDPPGVCVVDPLAQPMPRELGSGATWVASFFGMGIPTRAFFNLMEKATDATIQCQQWGPGELVANAAVSAADAVFPFTPFMMAESDLERAYWLGKGIANWTYPLAGDVLTLAMQMKMLHDVMHDGAAPQVQYHQGYYAPVPNQPPPVIYGNAPMEILPKVAQATSTKGIKVPQWKVSEKPKYKLLAAKWPEVKPTKKKYAKSS